MKCRNQLDCAWVKDGSGETICIEESSSNLRVFLPRTCTCYDKVRINNETGRCISAEGVQTAQEPKLFCMYLIIFQ